MIVSIANHLEMEVIAEGVEHVDQLDFLWEQQCRQVQGYIFSPPILPEQLPLHFHEIQKRSIFLPQSCRDVTLLVTWLLLHTNGKGAPI